MGLFLFCKEHLVIALVYSCCILLWCGILSPFCIVMYAAQVNNLKNIDLLISIILFIFSGSWSQNHILKGISIMGNML